MVALDTGVQTCKNAVKFLNTGIIVYWRVRSKIEEIFDKIPGVPEIFLNKSFVERVKKEAPLCQECFPEDGIGGLNLPDDFNDIKLEKEVYSYNLKLPNIKPAQWKMLGRNLLNKAYSDPDHGKAFDDGDTEDEELLPPPPEPSEYMKSMKYPLISVKATGINVEMLEELGDFFYDCADYIEMGENGKPMCAPPSDGTHPLEVEVSKQLVFDPEMAIAEELTEKIDISGTELVPGDTFKPYQDDDEDWIELCNKDAPVSDEEDLVEYEI